VAICIRSRHSERLMELNGTLNGRDFFLKVTK